MIAAHWAPVAEILAGAWPGLHLARVRGASGVCYSVVRMGWGYRLMTRYLTYPQVSSNMAGWKISEVNGGFNRKITHKLSIFRCHFDYPRAIFT